MWLTDENIKHVASWIPDAPNLPADVLVDLYPEYVEFGPYPKEFQELLVTLRSMLQQKVSFASLLHMERIDSYDLIEGINKDAKLGGDFGARASFLNSGSSKLTFTFMAADSVSGREGFYTAAGYFLYLAVIDKRLGRDLVSEAHLEKIREIYKAMELELQSKLADA